MFFFVALFVAGFILSAFFAPKPKIENARASSLSDFRFPRAKEGDPVPRLYGTIKTEGLNTIGQMNFKAVPIKKKVKTGLFSSKKVISGYQYKTGLDLAVCLGPNIRFRKLWFGKHLVWTGCLSDCVNTATINLPDLYGGKDQNGGIGGDITFYCGDFDQPQDSYLQTHLGANVPAYVGIAHMVFKDFWFGNSTNIEAVSCEVAAFSNSLEIPGGKYVMPNGLDINPVEALYDIYVNDWGNLGMDPNLIDVEQWREVGEQIYDEGIGMSVEIANPQQGGEITKEVLRLINGMIYQDPSTGSIQLKLIRQDYNVEDLPVLGPSEVRIVRNYTKKLWEDTINRVRVKYCDREAGYVKDKLAVADDFANIRFQGRIRDVTIGMPLIYVAELANEIAARELANLNVPLFQAELETNRTAVTLRPGDPFVLEWPEYEVTAMVMRIRKFGLGTREDGKVTMFVVQDEFAVDATVYGTPAPAIDIGEDYNSQDIIDYEIFELPYFLANAAGFDIEAGFTRYAAFADAPGTASIDFFAIVDSGTDDIEVLSNAPYSESAKLVVDLDKWAGFSNGIIDTLYIKEATSAAILTNSDTAGIRIGTNLFMLNGELLAYETFTDNLDGTYTLNDVHRSLIDTGWVAGLEDDVLYFFDGQEGFFEDASAIAAFDVYLLDRTIRGRSTEAGATLNPLVPIGRMFLAAPPDMVTIDAGRVAYALVEAGTNVDVDWRERSRISALLEIEDDATGVAEAATTYDIELYDDDTNALISDELAIAATTFSFPIPAAAFSYVGLFKVWAVKDGDRSFTAAEFPVNVLGDDARFTEEGEVRFTEDDNVRTIEG